jgi:major intracellular serine protease
MPIRKNKDKNCGLFPYIKEEVFGDFESRQGEAWSISKMNIPSLWSYSQGESVTVAVIDSGCDLNHEDLKQNYVQGKNFIDPSKEPMDENSHGTHVAGTIAAVNNRYGVVGVAPKTQIMPIKVFSADGRGSNIDVANAVVWAANNGADLLCMSLGSPYPSRELHQAILYAAKKKVVSFCAAGNGGEQSDIYYPAKYEDTVSIGAVDNMLHRTFFTCSGVELDFLAPGQDILSTTPNNTYSLMSGTSMANPFVVGCAALLLSFVKKNNIDVSLSSADDYINVFSRYTTNLQNPNHSNNKEYEGMGLLDARKIKGWEGLS